MSAPAAQGELPLARAAPHDHDWRCAGSALMEGQSLPPRSARIGKEI
jgi:hypothetical protein